MVFLRVYIFKKVRLRTEHLQNSIGILQTLRGITLSLRMSECVRMSEVTIATRSRDSAQPIRLQEHTEPFDVPLVTICTGCVASHDSSEILCYSLHKLSTVQLIKALCCNAGLILLQQFLCWIMWNSNHYEQPKPVDGLVLPISFNYG